jgi:hypothetical protein
MKSEGTADVSAPCLRGSNAVVERGLTRHPCSHRSQRGTLRTSGRVEDLDGATGFTRHLSAI